MSTIFVVTAAEFDSEENDQISARAWACTKEQVDALTEILGEPIKNFMGNFETMLQMAEKVADDPDTIIV